MFKRSFAVVLWLLIMFSLFGCGVTEQTISDSYNYLTDAQIVNTFDIGKVNMAKSPQGYYIYVDGKMYFVDGTSLEATSLCSKPNCLHSDDNCSEIGRAHV